MQQKTGHFSPFKGYGKAPQFLSHMVWNVTVLIALVLVSTSCDSDDMDSIEIVERNEVMLLPEGTSESITEILLDNGLTEFNEALNYVNEEFYTALVERFDTGTAQHTVFVPSNEAFYKLYDCLGMKSQDIRELGEPALIRDILQYHVVESRWNLDNITKNNEDSTLQSFYGIAFTVKSDGRIESVENSSSIILNESNKLATNGIVHIITDVIFPVEVLCRDNANN